MSSHGSHQSFQSIAEETDEQAESWRARGRVTEETNSEDFYGVALLGSGAGGRGGLSSLALTSNGARAAKAMTLKVALN